MRRQSFLLHIGDGKLVEGQKNNAEKNDNADR
jgi:hypothetical protein